MLYSESIKIDGKDRNEFTHEVLDKLRQRKVTWYDCQPSYVSIKLSGAVEVQFAGSRDGEPWIGTMKFNCPFPPDKLYLADPAIVAEICEQGLNLMEAT